MKNIILLVLLTVSLSFVSQAQKSKVTSASGYIERGMLDKAKEAIDQALLNEKTIDWPNTYFVRGKLCQEAYRSENPEFKLLFMNPLEDAFLSFEKAIELDTKGAVKKKIITNMIYNTLASDLYNQGSMMFGKNDFAGALSSFDNQIKVTESDNYTGSIDTGMYYNAGLAAVNAGKFRDAITYLNRCIEMKYLGAGPYYQIQSCYLSLGDTLKAESTLLSILENFPDEKDIFFHLITLYLNSNNYPEAFRVSERAKQKYPDNYKVYYASGIISLKQSNYDQAIDDMMKSVELKTDFFDSQFALGISFINKAADMNTKANEINDINKYNDAVNQMNEVYFKALPFIEKAHELKPAEEDPMRNLQQIYYRLKQKDPAFEMKYVNIKKELDNLTK